MPRKDPAEPEAASRPRVLTPERLREHPLPSLDQNGSKEDRGRVVVVGGTRGTSGAVLLAGLSALRAGAGKVQIATSRSAFALVAPQMPEALLIPLHEDRHGGLSGRSLGVLHGLAERADALCIGPGLTDAKAARRVLESLAPVAPNATWILDAAAVYALRGAKRVFEALLLRAVITPHAGEMAQLLQRERRVIEHSAIPIAVEFARENGCVVVLKGAQTVICSASGDAYLNRRGNAGLATGGSGDVLAGIVAACAARGASPLSAALHGVYTHAVAGERLARRIGAAGFLARELLVEVPAILFPIRTR